MVHIISPYEDQKNVATYQGRPEPAAIEIRFPTTFSSRAWHVVEHLEGTINLFVFGNHFVVTHEGLELDPAEARWTGDSLDELEAWLEETANMKDKEDPGWEEPFMTVGLTHIKGEVKTVIAAPLEKALKEALSRGYKILELEGLGSYEIEEYLNERIDEDDRNEPAYTMFDHYIVRTGSAWDDKGEIITLK